VNLKGRRIQAQRATLDRRFRHVAPEESAADQHRDVRALGRIVPAATNASAAPMQTSTSTWWRARSEASPSARRLQHVYPKRPVT
jgi:hypothetical protein